MIRRRRLFIVLGGIAVVAVIGAIGWGVTRTIGEWRDAAELERAVVEMASGQSEAALVRLSGLAERWPGRDEVEYRLGLCESILGHPDRALDAWSRVPTTSGMAPQVALARGRLALETGRLSVAEESLGFAEKASGKIAAEASRLMDQVVLFSGRGRELTRRFRNRGLIDPDLPMLLKNHWLFDTQPLPVGPVHDRLEVMGLQAPDDDRIWLGKADVAARLGRFDEADDWLRRCEARRPDDPEVSHVRLEWALAARKPEAAERALAHLPAHRFSPAELARLEASLASLRGNAEAERKALETLVELEPGDPAAWTRLADLAAAAGQSERRDQCRRRKQEIDQARDEYQKLIGAVTPTEIPDPVALARLAEKLGRRFEARGWWTIREHQHPGDPQASEALVRIGTDPPVEPSDGRTVADRVLGSRPTAKSGTGRSTVTPAVPIFRDDAGPAGLGFVYDNDQTRLRRLPETMGGGLGLIDYDGDGRLDVYCVQGGKFPTGTESTEGGDRLFRNRGDGTFEDVTEKSGIAAFARGFGHGVAVADFDNDGRADLFVTRFGSYALYRNASNGTFEDVTDRVGLGGPRGWPTSSAFADLDGDGDLDLYVCQYLRWDPATSAPCPDPDRPGGYLYCVPRGFESEPDRLFRNDGGRFVDVSAEAGIVDHDGRGLGVVIADLDDDGLMDIYVANDMTANFLFRNLGGLRFEQVGVTSGAGTNGEGGYQAGMGIACGDLDGDGRPELAVTNFYGESTTLFYNLGKSLFADLTATSGLKVPSRHVLGFGASFLDVNDDGYLDLATANGHVNDYRPAIPYAMPAQLYLGTGDAKLVEVSARAGDYWKVPRVGRGLAVGDLDHDGRQDLLILAQGGPLAYFHNLGSDRQGRSITIQLEGTKSNRDGVGARVKLTSAARPQFAQRIGGGSFLSSSDGRIHFGLGAGESPTVEVRWPSGQVDHHEGIHPGDRVRLIEGDPQPRPL